MIAFLDSSALIYLVEGAEPFASKVRAQLRRALHESPALQLGLSRLAWLECRVGPMRSNAHATLAAYDQFFARTDLIWVELSKEVVELAAAIRVRQGLKTPDALHAASCLQLGDKHLFLTGDTAFQRVAGLRVLLLSE